MTHENENTLMPQLLEMIGKDGPDALLGAFRLLLNHAMRLERSQALGALPYERSDERQGYANGFKDKTLKTRLGEVTVQVPQTRGVPFYPQSLERGCRSEKALKLAIAEMYVMGVSTRKVTAVMEKLCGLEVSSTQVSRLSAELDSELDSFRNRPLGVYRYVYLDAQYQKVRRNGSVRDLAVLIAIGVNAEGRREIIGVSTSLSEAEVHWRGFLESLQKRGLSGVELFISDDHAGLRKARVALFPSVMWQRCQFHLAQNAQAYVPKVEMRTEVGQAIRDIFNANSLEEARTKLSKTAKEYAPKAPELARWMEENLEEGFMFFQFPRETWRRLKTSNALERTNREVKRRTRVASLFPNEASCLRLVTAVLQEIHEEWVVGKAYLTTPSELTTVKPDQNFYRKNVA
jgi:putative transposase